MPRKIIEKYIRHACLCQLQVPTAPDRPLLLNAFLHGGNEITATSRRETFRLFLDMTSQSQGTAVNQHTFRQLLYFKASSNGIVYHPQPFLEEVFQRWRYYQAREYYAFAFNALWYYLCEWGLKHDGDIRPLPLEDFWRHFDESLSFDALAKQLQLPPPGLGANDSFTNVLEWLQTLVGADQSGFDAACTLEAPLHEDRLYQLAMQRYEQPHVMVAGMLIILGLVYLRFGSRDRWQEPAWEISQMGQDGRLSLADFILALRYRLQRRSTTVGDIVRWLFNALSTTIHELGLCGNLMVSVHPLTPDGQRFLTEGDLI